MSVTYDNGCNNEPLSEWMKRELFINEDHINRGVKIIHKADHVRVEPVTKLTDLNDAKKDHIYQY